MLTQQEREEQQAVLQELLAGPDQALVDAAMACRRQTAPLHRPARWPRRLAVGACLSHLLFALGLLLLALSGVSSEPTGTLFLGPAGFALLRAGAVLTPVGTLCGLAGILLARAHLSGWIMLVSFLTLPLNAYVCLLLSGIIPFEC